MSEEALQEQGAEAEVAATEEWSDDSSPEDQAEARAMGWKPPTEWKGDPPKNGFVKAKEFVERGRNILPIVQSQLKKKDDENAKLRDEIDRINRESAEKFSRLERMSQSALKQQRKQLEEKYESLKESAVETGDKETYRKIDKEQREALKEFDEAASEKAEKDDKKLEAKDELPPSMREAIKEWIVDNPWFKSDEEMNIVATHYHGRLMKEKPGLTLRENLAEVRSYIAKRYPEKFGGEDNDAADTTRRGSRVEGGTRMAGAGGKSAWSRLPADAQKQADRFIKEDGLFLEKGETVKENLQAARERYAVQYWEQNK